jgi:hypothetical protein
MKPNRTMLPPDEGYLQPALVASDPLLRAQDFAVLIASMREPNMPAHLRICI